MLLLICVVIAALVPSVHASNTIIDLLSSDTHFTELLISLQQAELVPLLNTPHGNLTLIAPTDSAIGNVSLDPDLLRYHIAHGVVNASQIASDTMDREYLFNSYLVADNGVPMPLVIRRDTRSPGQGGGSILIDDSRVIKSDWIADNGVIQVVDSLLTPPDDLCTTLSNDYNAQAHINLLRNSVNCSSLANTTLILLDDDVFNTLDEYQLALFSIPQGKAKLAHLLDTHIFNSSIYSGNLSTNTLVNYEGNNVSVSLRNSHLFFNHHRLSKPFYTKENVVIYHTNDMLCSIESLNYTPMDYMYASGNAPFADELTLHRLNGWAEDPSSEQTILIPQSDSMSIKMKTGELKYHFVVGKPQHKNGLLDTRYIPKTLGGAPQRIHYTTDEKGCVSYSESTFYGESKCSSIKEINVGNTTLLLVDEDIASPGSLANSLGNTLKATISSKLFHAIDMANIKSKEGFTTFYLEDSAWEEAGLVQTVLFNNHTKLKEFAKYLIFKGLFYSDSEPSKLKSLSGEEHILKWSENDQGLELYGEQRPVPQKDVLFRSGVAHSLNHFPIIDLLNITRKDLIDASRSQTFANFLHIFNISETLIDQPSYSILIPTDNALRYRNITTDIPFLETLLQIHVLQTDPWEDCLNGSHYATLVPQISISAELLSDDVYIFSIHGVLPGSATKSHRVRVLKRGWTSDGAQILLIDTEMIPDWMTQRDPRHIKPAIMLAIGIIVGIVLLSSILMVCFCCLFYRTRKSSSDGYEEAPTSPTNPNDSPAAPLNHADRMDIERRPLLRKTNGRSPNQSRPGSLPANADHSVPVPVPKVQIIQASPQT
ncbi:hypothetical protein CANCADRAFT_93479 [Tortispora caseinolytica NRRL Y-17796]|uniref:FAS1 domain-containing protein n=1 Tax=Tortispora caseinolytica NRRL Y-17796 TaxID=767744 RepID=A0A1E4TM16_9ASCO|nr:hypothetical protein CANCADRAFT_93479 [Tortispora caseinolytica NRRL Y-17796]